MKKNNFIFPVLLVLSGSFTLFILFYNLGGHYLEAWDEALYVLMARTAIQRNNYLYLIYQNDIHWDKSPFVILPMISTFRIFWISETTARISSALFGLGIFLQLFLLARRFYGRTASLLVPVIAATSTQWLFNHGLRSANVDSITLFFLTASISSWLLIRRIPFDVFCIFRDKRGLFEKS